MAKIAKAEWCPYVLKFKFEARTSRQSMHEKLTYLLRVTDCDSGKVGVGECALFQGLSAEDSPEYEDILDKACTSKCFDLPLSSIRFGYETAMKSLEPVEDNPFTRGEEGIPTNGLIWMGDKATMKERIDAKLADGFQVLKLKIGGINFEDEIDLLRYIRGRYSVSNLELRLDANGHFSSQNALECLKRLNEFDIHSIEQPIMAGQIEEMARICEDSPIPVALDEELIGVRSTEKMKKLLETIRPAYVILKPSLCGGIGAAESWIDIAQSMGIGWWVTSALESNIGLEHIARWIYPRLKPDTSGHILPQGLGTGLLYSNNFPSHLQLRGEKLFYNPEVRVEILELSWRR